MITPHTKNRPVSQFLFSIKIAIKADTGALAGYASSICTPLSQ